MAEDAYWTHIEEAFDKVSIYDGAEVFLDGFKQYPAWVGDLLATHWMCSEHLNGGLTQFFLNSTGVLAPEAIAGLRKMNQLAAAAAVEEAVKVFGPTYPRDRDERVGILAAKSGHKPEDDGWSAYDFKYFKPMEDKLDEAGGGPSLGEIYNAMDAYAIASAGSK